MYTIHVHNHIRNKIALRLFATNNSLNFPIQKGLFTVQWRRLYFFCMMSLFIEKKKCVMEKYSYFGRRLKAGESRLPWQTTPQKVSCLLFYSIVILLSRMWLFGCVRASHRKVLPPVPEKECCVRQEYWCTGGLTIARIIQHSHAASLRVFSKTKLKSTELAVLQLFRFCPT